MSLTADSVVRHLRAVANPTQAKLLAGFFKTAPGQYGEGDIFWGVMVPQVRAIVKIHRGLPLLEIEKLVTHSVHEVRLAGWFFLVEAYKTSQKEKNLSAQKSIFDFYLSHTQYANNWDLVDLSAPHVVGNYLLTLSLSQARVILKKLVSSKVLWERRIAVLATFAFIRAGEFSLTLDLCQRLLADRHDLMHKACGWMLREMGKHGGLVELRGFLERFSTQLPRTMLRYAIERLNPDERKKWMKKK